MQKKSFFTMKILNIHGYKGSAENAACIVLKEQGHDVISPQIDYDTANPEKILEKLKNIFTENKPDYIVGTSLGGFFALLLSIESKIPAILVNPCLMPFITLPELDYGRDISGFIKLFGNFSQINQSNVCTIIGGNDEVISYHDFTKQLISNYTVVPEGKHSGSTLPLNEFFGKRLENGVIL